MYFSPRSGATLFTLAALVALGPLSTDMYLPALPRLAEVFSAKISEVQLTLSVFLAGFAIAQLVYGPLSDRYGRKPVLVSGLAVFLLASAGCALSSSIEQITFFRFLQALGGSAGPVLGRAIIRDIYPPDQAGKALSNIASVMAIAPAIAPIAGGVMTVHLGWESIFWFLVIYCFIGTGIFALKVEESVPPEHRKAKSPSEMSKDYLGLLKDSNYLGYVLACSFSYAGLFAFLSGGAFVLIGTLGVSEQMFGWLFLVIVVGFIIGTRISAKLSLSKSLRSLIMLGSGLQLLAGVIMIAVFAVTGSTISGVVIPMALYMTGMGIVMPQTTGGALKNYPHMAGTASGMLGFIQMSTAGLVGIMVGHGFNDTAGPMLWTIAAMAVATLLSYRLFVRHTSVSVSEV